MKVLTLAGRAFAVGHSMARTDVIAPQARCAVVVPLRISFGPCRYIVAGTHF